MIMAGYHFMGDKPFQTVYLHGIVRDTEHRKMSKSLGNGIDPLDVVRLFGADALRWTAIAGVSLGSDLILDPNDLEATFAPGRNFANKLWNIGRFILAQLPERVPLLERFERSNLPLADRWILMRANDAVAAVTTSLEQFRLDEAAKRCYEFVWGDLADWYVEAVKPRFAAGDAEAAQAVLAYCFDSALRLLHPVVPFITEELWQKLPGRAADELLAAATWPRPRAELANATADTQFARVQEVISAIRNLRAEYRVAPKARIAATVTTRNDAARRVLLGERETILRLAQLAEPALDGKAGSGDPGGPGGHAVLRDGSAVFVPLGGAIDVQQECRRLS